MQCPRHHIPPYSAVCKTFFPTAYYVSIVVRAYGSHDDLSILDPLCTAEASRNRYEQEERNETDQELSDETDSEGNQPD